jgi:hypothetical protein
MSERKELTRREQLIAILRHGGAPCDEVAELVTNNHAAEVRAEQAAEIRELNAHIVSLEGLLAEQTAESDHPDTRHCTAEYGGPGYSHCELTAGHDGQHEAAMGNMRRATWGGDR